MMNIKKNKKEWYLTVIFITLFFLPIFTSIGISTAQTISEPIAYGFRLPLDGDWSVSQDFAKKWNKKWCGYHLAEDVLRDSEVPVYAAADGIVKLAERKGEYGYLVIIQHRLPPGDPDGDYVCTLYGHLREEGLISVDKGDKYVSKGDIIGYLSIKPEDNQGIIHLHFGIRKDKFLGEEKDSRTERWYYPGYTRIYREGILQCDPADPIHQEILSEWFNPTTDSKNGEGFIERHQKLPPAPIVTLEHLSIEVAPKTREAKPGDTINYKLKLDWKPETWEGKINVKIVITALGLKKTYEYPSVSVKGKPPVEETFPVTIPDNIPPLSCKATVIVEADGKTASDETSLTVKVPGFEVIFAIAGLLAIAYLLRRRK